MTSFFKKIAESALFQNFVTIVILLAGIVVGLETRKSLVSEYGQLFHILNNTILTIFVIEIIIKMLAEGSKPWRYFKDPWNVFDFTIVAASFLPIGSQYVTVLRLLRLLRVLRLVRALPKLQILVGALLKSIPSMFYVSVLLFLLFYVYAVAATFMFSANDPVHFETLEMSFLSLFRAVTLEDWTDLMYINMYGCANYGYDGMMDLCTQSSAMGVGAAIFFVSFVLIGTMVILNLFIGVIMNGMDEAQVEQEAARRIEEKDESTLSQEIDKIERNIKELMGQLEKLKSFSIVYEKQNKDK